ncbi:HNH endonuclease [Polymorphospora rubra]|uniref:HNH endonuclease n=1 Tax=Polymorphospora rubra TaxID=338584 RepID=UPI0033DA265A
MSGGWADSDRRTHLPANWPHIRQRILTRDGHRCTALDNGTRCDLTATDVHHIGDRDDHSDDNLTSLCAWHHKQETTKEGQAARRAKAAERLAERRAAERHPGLL